MTCIYDGTGEDVGKWDYDYWTLVESVRTERGCRQRIVATLGKVPGLNKEERVGWEEVTPVLNNGRPKPESDLFEKENDIPQWANVDTRRVRVFDRGIVSEDNLDYLREKERAMLKRQLDKLTDEFEKIKKGINEGRYTKAAAMIDVELIKDGKRLVDLNIQRKTEKLEWAEKANGCYLLRTDLTEEAPKKLWQVYMQLNQAEKGRPSFSRPL